MGPCTQYYSGLYELLIAVHREIWKWARERVYVARSGQVQVFGQPWYEGNTLWDGRNLIMKLVS